MKLENPRWVGLLIVAAAMAACGGSSATSEGTLEVRPLPVVNAAPNVTDVKGPAALGVPQYAGMETVVEARRTPLAKRGDMTESDFKSSDPPEQIAAFYREQMSKKYGEDTQYLETPLGEGMVRLQATNGEGKNIEVLIGPDGAGSIVGVRTLGMTN